MRYLPGAKTNFGGGGPNVYRVTFVNSDEIAYNGGVALMGKIKVSEGRLYNLKLQFSMSSTIKSSSAT